MTLAGLLLVVTLALWRSALPGVAIGRTTVAPSSTPLRPVAVVDGAAAVVAARDGSYTVFRAIRRFGGALWQAALAPNHHLLSCAPCPRVLVDDEHDVLLLDARGLRSLSPPMKSSDVFPASGRQGLVRRSRSSAGLVLADVLDATTIATLPAGQAASDVARVAVAAKARQAAALLPYDDPLDVARLRLVLASPAGRIAELAIPIGLDPTPPSTGVCIADDGSIAGAVVSTGSAVSVATLSARGGSLRKLGSGGSDSVGCGVSPRGVVGFKVEQAADGSAVVLAVSWPDLDRRVDLPSSPLRVDVCDGGTSLVALDATGVTLVDRTRLERVDGAEGAGCLANGGEWVMLGDGSVEWRSEGA